MPGGSQIPLAGRIFLALAIGTAGGFAFAYLRLPLPFMLGALASTTVAALCGVPIYLPQNLRNTLIVIIGVMLGSAFTPALLGQIVEWAVSLVALLAYILVAASLVMLYLRKATDFDPVTAYFCSAPGGLAEMVVAGREMGGDDRLISLMHATRVFLVVMVLPFWFRFTGDYTPPASVLPWVGEEPVGAIDLAILGATAICGYFLGRLIRLPAAALTGPMLLSAIVHLLAITDSAPPAILVSLAQVVIGTALGCRFVGVALPLVLRTMRLAVGSTAILLGTTTVFALGLHALTDLPTDGAILAFSPGGMAEMALVALSLDIDTAYVSVHHVVRIALVIVLARLIFGVLRRRNWLGIKVDPNRSGTAAD